MNYDEKVIEAFAIKIASEIKREIISFLENPETYENADTASGQMLTETELCNLLGVGRKKLWSMRSDGILSYEKEGRNIVYDSEHVKSYLKSGILEMNGFAPNEAIKQITKYINRRG